MQFSLVEPQGVVWEGQAKEVLIPTREGEMCVLDFHQPFFIRLSRGRLRFSGGSFMVAEGVAIMKGNSLNVYIERDS